ncbi:hypothetical protein PJF56_02670 [Roseofilum sp. BLCC_M91]|uniref:Uncharacterized protein n=1 Tax=Roseofilum halophilum BLCC-M91 TaxID=3022259 RepID=A0ABT7BF08_9CYAN|nr:hypothetical protein [Roseofilum halophilum]MDJ1177760.1 hypothetical protein [Roseofilum halophilum BLCC-M91]
MKEIFSRHKCILSLPDRDRQLPHLKITTQFRLNSHLDTPPTGVSRARNQIIAASPERKGSNDSKMGC